MSNSVWIITKDMRLEDNNLLKEALKNSQRVYAVFLLDPEQTTAGFNNSLHFMIESLEVLNAKLKTYGGCVHMVLKADFSAFISTHTIQRAYILKGFTDFEKNRNAHYASLVPLIEIDDVLGMPREFFLKADGSAYLVFSPYMKNIVKKGGLPSADMNIPTAIHKCVALYTDFNFLNFKQDLAAKPTEATWLGGSDEGIAICQARYHNLQIFLLDKQGVSHNQNKMPRKDVAPHVKFGTVSPRLVYHCGLLEQDAKDIYAEHVEARGILWRALHYSLMDTGRIISKHRQVVWNQNPQIFQLWVTGQTGFDFVDAGIHQLLRSGSMDNELRMLTANFLVFVFGVDWRQGEEFFRQHLVDYDWPLNVGNWAWTSQIGMDNPSPNRAYGGKAIRIFNPITYKTKNKAEKQYREQYIDRWLNRPKNSLAPVCDFRTQVDYNLQYY